MAGMLLLLSKFQKKPSFDFVPYKYGCFSFQANADLNVMTKYGQVENAGLKWKKLDEENYSNNLKKSDFDSLFKLKEAFGRKDASELIEFTYKRYPYYAINSTLVDKVLDEESKLEVEKHRKIALRNFYTKKSELISDAKNKTKVTSLAVFKPSEVVDFKIEAVEKGVESRKS